MTRAGTAGGTWRSVVRTGALWGAGAVFLALVQAAAGAIGAAMLLLPPAVRRPVIVGLGTAFVIGLFQDLVQLMLQSGVRAGLRSLLFTGEGLAPRGAVILMVLAAGGNIF